MIFQRSIVVLGAAAALYAVPAARAEPIAAYMYSQSGAAGVPTLAAMKPAAIGTVFLKAVDIDSAGAVFPKLDYNGRFYPNAWNATPRPVFAAMVNADPGIDWGSVNPTTTLTSALTSNNWQQDYGGGITVDAEFTANIQSFPANWQSMMTALRNLANGQGQNFSLYVSPKYLSASRYPATAAANAATLKQILGTPATGIVNSVLFPVYAGDGSNVDQTTLASAASAAQTQAFAYQWIFDITESPTTFSAGLQSADGAGPRPAGYVAYSYLDTQSITADMTTNMQALANLAAVPEPSVVALALAGCMVGLAAAGRSRWNRS
ncbi:MAG: hypothetical protein ACKO1M_00870 [Planctomycetota bacterium]